MLCLVFNDLRSLASIGLQQGLGTLLRASYLPVGLEVALLRFPDPLKARAARASAQNP